MSPNAIRCHGPSLWLWGAIVVAGMMCAANGTETTIPNVESPSTMTDYDHRDHFEMFVLDGSVGLGMALRTVNSSRRPDGHAPGRRGDTDAELWLTPRPSKVPSHAVSTSTEVEAVILRVTITIGTAASIGAFRDGGMKGPIVTCYAPTANPSDVACADVDGYNFGVTPATLEEGTGSRVEHCELRRAGIGGNPEMMLCEVRVPITRFPFRGGHAALIVVTFCDFDTQQRIPVSHGPLPYAKLRAAMPMNGGPVLLTLVPTTPLIDREVAYSAVGCLVALAIGGGAVVQWARGPYYLSPMWVVRWKAAVCVFIVTASVIIAVAAYFDFASGGRTQPFGRACGEVVMFLFSLLFVPVCKYGPSWVGSSMERTAWVHVTLGLLLFAWMALHGVVMMAPMVIAPSPDGGPHAELDYVASSPRFVASGLGAFVGLTAMTVGATVLKKKGCFLAFRLTHLLFPVVVLCSVVHVPRLWKLMLPGFALWCADVGVRLLRVIASRAELVTLQCFPSAGVVKLQIAVRWAQRPEAGSYVFLLIPAISGIMHPFTVAATSDRNEDGAERRIITVFVKCTEEMHLLERERFWAPSPWTTRLARRATAVEDGSKTLPAVFVVGPFGSLQAPLRYGTPSAHTRHTLLVAGGIGVTLMMSIVDCIAAQHRRRCAGTADPATEAHSVTLLWSCREAELAEVFLLEMEPLWDQLLRHHVEVSVQVFVTGPVVSDSQRANLQRSSRWRVQFGRMEVRSELKERYGPLLDLYNNNSDDNCTSSVRNRCSCDGETMQPMQLELDVSSPAKAHDTISLMAHDVDEQPPAQPLLQCYTCGAAPLRAAVKAALLEDVFVSDPSLVELHEETFG